MTSYLLLKGKQCGGPIADHVTRLRPNTDFVYWHKTTVVWKQLKEYCPKMYLMQCLVEEFIAWIVVAYR